MMGGRVCFILLQYIEKRGEKQTARIPTVRLRVRHGCGFGVAARRRGFGTAAVSVRRCVGTGAAYVTAVRMRRRDTGAVSAGTIYTMLFLSKRDRYFDAGSFTPVDPVAYAAMREVLRTQVGCAAGNPASAHRYGMRAEEYMSHARAMLARVHQVREGNILFSSGATESNLIAMRTAILGAHRAGLALSDMHVVVGRDEHGSVHRHLAYYRRLGVTCTVAAPETGKRFTPRDAARAVRNNTVFVSLQYVNSMDGTVQPIAKLADACRERQPSVFIHTDAAQATAYYPCSPESLRVDAVTVDGAKAFGPQGVGALLFRKAERHGGFSGECAARDMRPGTPSVALVYGFAVASCRAHRRRDANTLGARRARRAVAERIAAFAPDAYIRGIEKPVKDVGGADWDMLAPHLLYVSFPHTRHAYLATLLDADGFAVSTATACTDETDEGLRIGVLPTATPSAVRALTKCIARNLPTGRKV